MSGGGDVQNFVQVATKPALVPASLQKLDQSFLLQQLQVTLDGANTAVEDSGESFHCRPAKPGFVVGVISKAAVGRDHFSRNTPLNQFGGFWYPGESWFSRHNCLLEVCGGSLCGIFTQRAAVVQAKTLARRFFYALLMVEL